MRRPVRFGDAELAAANIGDGWNKLSLNPAKAGLVLNCQDEFAGVLVTAIPALPGGTGLPDELPSPIIYLHEEISRIKVYPAGVEEIIDTVAIR